MEVSRTVSLAANDTQQSLASLLKDVPRDRVNDIVLDAISRRGWIVQPDKKPTLFLTASELQAGSLSENNFYVSAKDWCTLANLPLGLNALFDYHNTIA
jgi:hypothetical protein